MTKCFQMYHIRWRRKFSSSIYLYLIFFVSFEQRIHFNSSIFKVFDTPGKDDWKDEELNTINNSLKSYLCLFFIVLLISSEIELHN